MLLYAKSGVPQALTALLAILSLWHIEGYRVVHVVDNTSTNSNNSLAGKYFFAQRCGQCYSPPRDLDGVGFYGQQGL